jgi:hypothetical protein
MTPFIQLVSSLREQMHASVSRSDVLKPLAWLIGILFTGLVLLLLAKAPNWLLVFDAIALGATLALYVFSYIYCLLKDRDALRSERYSLEKMAIEHGIFGDSETGTFEASAREPTAIEAPSASKNGQ